MFRKSETSTSWEIPQSARVVVLLANTLSPGRQEFLKWKPRCGAHVGGVCRIESSSGKASMVALTSGEQKPLNSFDELAGSFDWAREELLSAFEGKSDFLICDLLGPEIILGDGLDSGVRAILWKDQEDEHDDDVEKSLVILVVSDEVLIDYLRDAYRLNEHKLFIFRGDPALFKERAEVWYDKHHSRFLLRRSRLRQQPASQPSSIEDSQDEVSGHFYAAARFPLLFGVLVLVGIELLLYTALLQIVNFYETAFRSHREARKALALATHESSWRRCARKLDNLESKPGGSLPALSLAKNFLIRLERALAQVESDDTAQGKEEIIRCLFEITAPDAVHMLLPESLYTHNHTGRNQEASRFVELVEKAIDFIANAQDVRVSPKLASRHGLSPRSVNLIRKLDTTPRERFASVEEEFQIKTEDEKRKILSELSRAYGSTALCLSGGASNAFFHLGVVRTLLERGVLPRHLSGASGGALVGSFIATHTDDELRVMLNNPALLSRIFDPCSGAGWSVLAMSLLTKPSIFDPTEWAEKLKNKVCGTMTFQEAFLRTGRSLTIMVFNGDRHTRALNHKTAPDICIFSAVLASSAIPKLLPAMQLLRKTKSGEIVPFDA